MAMWPPSPPLPPDRALPFQLTPPWSTLRQSHGGPGRARARRSRSKDSPSAHNSHLGTTRGKENTVYKEAGVGGEQGHRSEFGSGLVLPDFATVIFNTLSIKQLRYSND